MMPSLISPVSASLPLRAISVSRSASFRMTLAWRMSAAPSSVGTMGLLLRSKILIPSSSSSLRICMLSVGWVTKHFSAVTVNCRQMSRDTMYWSWVNVMLELS